jgi:alanine dehydrogenase
MAMTQGRRDIVLLSGHDLRRLLQPQVVIAALREVYAALAQNREDQGRSLGFAVEGGSIHVKSGLLPGSRSTFASKVNVNLPGNWSKHGLPTIQGVVVVVDAKDGRPLAVMESMALTGLRTAATAALAATFGARANSQSLAIIGCGAQASYQLDALRAVFPLQTVRVFDTNREQANTFATAATTATCAVTAMPSVREAVKGADICVTCTTSKSPVLTDSMDLQGCFVAAVGADNPEKQEIAPNIMSRARVLVDDLDACAAGGDLHHALRERALTRDGVHADLAQLAAGHKMGRASDEETVIFDSTGSGVQDVAAAWAAYREATQTGIGSRFDLAGTPA